MIHVSRYWQTPRIARVGSLIYSQGTARSGHPKRLQNVRRFVSQNDPAQSFSAAISSVVD
jgi:hypothetical protein